MITQIFLYIWIQHSVRGHFEQMDSETLTHAAFNLRQRMSATALEQPSTPELAKQTVNSPQLDQQPLANPKLDYEVKIIIANKSGQILSSSPTGFTSAADSAPYSTYGNVSLTSLLIYGLIIIIIVLLLLNRLTT